jgi:hypothetical protein
VTVTVVVVLKRDDEEKEEEDDKKDDDDYYDDDENDDDDDDDGRWLKSRIGQLPCFVPHSHNQQLIPWCQYNVTSRPQCASVCVGRTQKFFLFFFPYTDEGHASKALFCRPILHRGVNKLFHFFFLHQWWRGAGTGLSDAAAPTVSSAGHSVRTASRRP